MAGPSHHFTTCCGFFFFPRAISHRLHLEFRYTAFVLYGMFAYAGLCYIENELYSTTREKKRVFLKNYWNINQCLGTAFCTQSLCVCSGCTVLLIIMQNKAFFPSLIAQISTALAKSTCFWTKISHLPLEGTAEV